MEADFPQSQTAAGLYDVGTRLRTHEPVATAPVPDALVGVNACWIFQRQPVRGRSRRGNQTPSAGGRAAAGR